MDTIDLFLVQEETLSLDEFVNLFESNRAIIVPASCPKPRSTDEFTLALLM